MKTKAQFVEQAGKGCLTFTRGRLRLHRAPNKDNVVKLTVVCATPRMFEVPSVSEVPANDGRVVPVRLSAISASATGKLSLDIAGTQLLAAGALAVVKATQEADTVMRDESYGIKNYVVDALDPDTATKDKVYHAVTSAVLSRLNRYALGPDTTALIHITNITGNELHVADVWQLQGDTPDLTVFKAEVEAAAKALTAPGSLKRKPTTMDDMFPEPKRLHPHFDTPCES